MCRGKEANRDQEKTHVCFFPWTTIQFSGCLPSITLRKTMLDKEIRMKDIDKITCPHCESKFGDKIKQSGNVHEGEKQ